jgi:hypothetical protein
VRGFPGSILNPHFKPLFDQSTHSVGDQRHSPLSHRNFFCDRNPHESSFAVFNVVNNRTIHGNKTIAKCNNPFCLLNIGLHLLATRN